MQKYFIGIDLGTGSTKAVAVDATGETIFTAQSHYPTINTKPEYSEQNADLIWDAFVACINQAITELHAAPAAISFSSAMHSIMPVDEHGTPLANAILWADARSANIAEELRKSDAGEDIYRKTGTAIYAMSPLCKLMWLRQNEQELFNKAHKFISLKEYVWFKLFGVYEVDYSIASTTGMFDILELKWYHKSLELAGLDANKLSAPVNTTYTRYLDKTLDTIPGISNQTAFVAGASDGCCANLGGGAVTNGVAALTIGTSGAVRVASPQPVYNYQAMTFNYLLTKGRYICGGAVNNGGAAADWLLKDFLKRGDITKEAYKLLFTEVEMVEPGSNGLIFLPYLYAERAPIWDANSSASFLNISYKHKQQHFLRAVIEGICFALNDVLKAIEGDQPFIKEIVISGGFISSAVWVQILADITGKRLVKQKTGDASAIGAIHLALEALDINADEIFVDDNQTETIEPDMDNHALYSKMFPIYKKVYTDLKESMQLMHDLRN
ncbi:gluconokinase [Mucilaginibacter pallidiroseus]|uniref:Gluconokinase n=2 Tax=Mucilaginibacter pallidiroseus TaxID=2599295 RepID=A0A563UKD8_9SPHI|nr:gluconokinase [Mucilaginibacter pallidiroseus]